MSAAPPRPRGILQRIIHAAADKLAADPTIAPDARDAYRAAIVHVFEATICDLIGCDTVQISGWSIAPSARANRRERILQALEAGEPVRTIAARELVSERWVRKLAATELR